jgi:hypothetical protein
MRWMHSSALGASVSKDDRVTERCATTDVPAPGLNTPMSEPRDAGHFQIHQHDAGSAPLHQLQQLGARVSFTYDVDVLVVLERTSYAGDDERMVVRDQHFQTVFGRSTSAPF